MFKPSFSISKPSFVGMSVGIIPPLELKFSEMGETR